MFAAHNSNYHSETLVVGIDSPDGTGQTVEVTLTRDSNNMFACPGCNVTTSHRYNMSQHLSSNPEHLDQHEPPHPLIEKAGDGPLKLIPEWKCVIHLAYRILICLNQACQRAIEPNAIMDHLLVHQITVHPKAVKLLIEANSLVGASQFRFKHPIGGLPLAIEQIPTQPGFCCSHPSCTDSIKGYLKRVTLKEHAKRVHPMLGGAGAFAKPCTVQSVFGNPQQYYRVVIPATSSEDPGSLFMSVKEAMPPTLIQTPLSSLQGPELTPFLKMTQWHRFAAQVVEKVNPFDLYQQSHTAKSKFPQLFSAVEHYCIQASEAVKGSTTLLRRWVETKGDASQE